MPIKHLKPRKLSGGVVVDVGVVSEGAQRNYTSRFRKEHLGHADSLHVFRVSRRVTLSLYSYREIFKATHHVPYGS